MNWVAIDIGSTDIKASVLDKKNTPIRLSFPMGGYFTTRLSAAVVITSSGEIVVGDDAILYGIMNPESLISDWQNHPIKKDIYKALLVSISNAAKVHYDDDAIAAVILYNRMEDEDLIKAGKEIFSEVQSIASSIAFVKTIPTIKSGLTIIADFGAKSFKVSIIENGEQKSSTYNSDLGFQKLDVESLIDSVQWDALNNVETSLYGLMIQKVKIALNSASPCVLPYKTKATESAINNEYKRCITTYLYQCFEECSSSLMAYSKTWNDVANIVFVGGGANSAIINSVFLRYMEGKGCALKSYNSTTKQFDTQYAATHIALQLPLRQKTGVTIKY